MKPLKEKVVFIHLLLYTVREDKFQIVLEEPIYIVYHLHMFFQPVLYQLETFRTHITRQPSHPYPSARFQYRYQYLTPEPSQQLLFQPFCLPSTQSRVIQVCRDPFNIISRNYRLLQNFWKQE